MSEYPLEVTCSQVRDRLAAGDEFLLLDCRNPNEHAMVHLPQAMLLPMSEIGQRVSELEAWKDREIVVHCHHGGRSLRVAQWLRQQGFERTSSMAGGIDDWAVSIDPTLARY